MQTFETILAIYQNDNELLVSEVTKKLEELKIDQSKYEQEIEKCKEGAILCKSRHQPEDSWIDEKEKNELLLNAVYDNIAKNSKKYEQYLANKIKPSLSDIFQPTTSVIELKDIDFGDLLFTENSIQQNDVFIIIDKHCKFINCNITSLKFENYSNLIEEQKYDLIFDSFYNKDDNNLNIVIENSHFYGKFYINRKNLQENTFNERDVKIKSFYIKNSTFHQNFKLHNASVGEFDINDSNFEDKADFFKTQFLKGKNQKSLISFYAINFNELSIFEECEFCKKVDFTYVTFKGLSQFRKATFKQGLNLDNTNIEKDMNFFEIQSIDSSASKEQTSQETYRIIKHQLEKQNNKIEANRYYSCELEKRRQYLANNLKSIENILSYIVFALHNMTSSHGRNYFLVLLWIFNVGCFTFIYLNTSISNILITSILIFALFISTICFSGIAGAGFFLTLFFSLLGLYETPFELKKVLAYTSILNENRDGFSIILFANKIALGYLYYQFITSVRKDTSK